MKAKHYITFLQCWCSLATVSSLHPSNFQRTKAEDTDGIYSGDNLNASPSCDMTSQFCDLNCCSDQDCSETEKQSFICTDQEYNNNRKFSYLECENLGSFNSLGNPLLCLHDQNSPYLGDFYEKDENFSSKSFSEILKSRNKEISSFRMMDSLGNNNRKKYKMGLDILFLDTEGQYHTINMFSNVLSKGNGYCSKVPLKFFIDETSSCFFVMDEEQCLLNEELHLQHHLNIIKKLEFLGEINDVNISYNVVCLKEGTGFVAFKKNAYHGKADIDALFSDIRGCGTYTITEVNKNKTACENVVVGLNYTISVNGTDLRSLRVTVFIANIPIYNKYHKLMDKGVWNHLHTNISNIILALQKTSVKFENSELVNNIKNYGYILGKPLYIR